MTPNELFAPPQTQRINFTVWNMRLGLNLPDPGPAPAFVWDPNRPFKWPLLTWTLGNLKRSMDAKLIIMGLEYGENNVHVTDRFKTDPGHLRQVYDASEFIPNTVWWELTDFGANRDKSPMHVPAETAAGFQVFDAATQFTSYVRSMDREDYPCWDASGLRSNAYDDDLWTHCPYIEGGPDGIFIDAVWADNNAAGFARPETVQEV